MRPEAGTITLYDTLTGSPTAITVNATQPLTATSTIPGQLTKFTFTGTANESIPHRYVKLHLSGLCCDSSSNNPTGGSVGNSVACGASAPTRAHTSYQRKEHTRLSSNPEARQVASASRRRIRERWESGGLDDKIAPSWPSFPDWHFYSHFRCWLQLLYRRIRSLILCSKSDTILPDGNHLLLGGVNSLGSFASGSLLNVQTGSIVPLRLNLKFARAWHTATVLGDGTVAVIGGVGKRGKTLNVWERFLPESQTFDLISVSGVSARSHHTTTLLSDGSVLIVGGRSASGETLADAQLWNPRTNLTTSVPGGLSSPRRDHSAILQSDGTVLISGGSRRHGTKLKSAERVRSQDWQVFFRTSATFGFERNRRFVRSVSRCEHGTSRNDSCRWRDECVARDNNFTTLQLSDAGRDDRQGNDYARWAKRTDRSRSRRC